MNRTEVIKWVDDHLAHVGHGFEFEIIEAGVRQDEEWWWIPVLAKSPTGTTPPREFLISVYSNIELEAADEHGVNLLLIPAA